MHFVVIGPGALGSLFAASLSAYGQHEVWIVDHNRSRAELLSQNGLILDNGKETINCPIQATSDSNLIANVDCVFICVKSHQIQAAIEQNLALLQSAPLTIAFQNGLTHLKPLAANLPQGKWAVGVTSQGATLCETGRVRHGGQGLTSLGFMDSPPVAGLKLLQEVSVALTNAQIQAITVTDILAKIWQKLLVNAGINALTAINDCQNGDLLDSKQSCQRMQNAVREGAAVAEALGISLELEPLSLTMKVCRDTCTNISSMLQDVRNKRKTEIDAINCAIVAEGHRLGIPVSENESLVRQIKNIENSYLTDSP